MDEICEKAEAAERNKQVISEGRKANLEKKNKQAKICELRLWKK